MAEIRKSLRCCGILLRRDLGGPKMWLIVVMMVVFSFYNYAPLCTIADFYKVPVAPWAYPFFLSFPTMQVVNNGLCLLLFSDTGETDGYAELMVARSGHRAYMTGQLLCVICMAFLYAAALWALSILFTLPEIGWDADWGVLLHTLAESSGQVQGQTGVNLSIIVSPEVLAIFTPIEATLICLVCIGLSAAFMGVLICFFRVFVSRPAGIFATGILVAMALFANSLGMFTFGRWLQFVSPLSWSGLLGIDWYHSGFAPGPEYVFTVWIGGIVVMSFAAVWKFGRRDLE
ncbi:MAG: hypothetical protein HFE91_07885 [Acutalibacter sp.]|jgi:hypothetical protein|uniref:hypothetical protein n=1 Tax=Acutalibacter sp. TaxID=1918636 RepID=UPI0021711BA2|nr:hypothetical protein [Acutalibacter sp.]MCI9225373.1 hypothetical protein [Acutalibacter sp.]